MGTRYDVFLCHNSKDKPAVLELALKLRESEIEPWLDKAELPGGVHWLKQAAQGMGACRSCAFFVGPNGLGQWQEAEVQIAIERHVKQGHFPVIPVILPGADEKCLPEYLNGYTWVAFPKTLNDDEAIHRLACYIRGTSPGLSPGEPSNKVECPFRGLEFFDVAHAPYFYGREELTARLIEKLKPSLQNKSTSRFLAIVGASGSGKSSLARAGLVAALQREAIEGSDQWPVVIARPGFDPCTSLAVELARLGGLDLEKQASFRDRLKDRMQRERTALDEDVRQLLSSGDSKRRLVILVDQFEELFTICRDEKLRAAFVDNLVYASQVPQGRAVVILAMRADFYGKCATYSDLANAVSEHHQLIGPMTRDELQQVIEKPAQKVGCELVPGLVELLLGDVVQDPGSLPFLQFALKELWNRRTGRRLTTEAYRDIGRVTGALQRKADEVYARLSEPQKRICRRIFLRLTQPGEGTEDTKRRVPISELKPEAGSPAEVEAVLLGLSEAETRLITGKAEDGEEFFEVAHEALIRGWPELRKWIDADRQALLTQRRLTEAANEWKDHGRDTSFLYSGARLAAAKEWALTHADDISPLESEFVKDSGRHARGQFIKIAVALMLVTLVGFGAVTWEWRNAEQAAQAERAALKESETLRKSLEARLRQLILSPDGSTLLASGSSDVVRLWDARTGKVIGTIQHKGLIWAVAFSPDGSRILTAGADTTARLWNAQTLAPIGTPMRHQDEIHCAVFSPDGRLVLTGSQDSTAQLWDSNTGESVGQALRHGSAVEAVLFSRDGRRAWTGGSDLKALTWDVPTQRPIEEIPPLSKPKA
jgi:hypothetical protein